MGLYTKPLQSRTGRLSIARQLIVANHLVKRYFYKQEITLCHVCGMTLRGQHAS